MRLVYFDIDTLRADHLGCYGYLRDTSPNIDDLASGAVLFENVYASDTPCLPSRSALISGRFGIRNGVINHGGAAADPLTEGRTRKFQTRLAETSWPRIMRGAGMSSATISTFGERHSAYHWYAGFNEVYNLGLMGYETADQVSQVAIDWLRRNGRNEDWFLHVHFWDPHMPYRTPGEFGDPFADRDAPDWITEEVRSAHWALPGPHSAQEVTGYGPEQRWQGRYPRQPEQIDSLDQVRKMFDGYDTGVRYADHHIGRILDEMAELRIFDEAAVMVSSDHGETLGELGIYCDHQTADLHTQRVPLILRWPGISGGRVDRGLYYQIDVAATVLELLGAEVPSEWDGRSFAQKFGSGLDAGRDHLVLSHAAWTVQRSVRFDDWLCIRTYHDAYHGLPDVMLFDVARDPHEQENLAGKHSDIVEAALSRLNEWQTRAMLNSGAGVDPLWTVIAEGGGWHARDRLPSYLERLRATERSDWADRLASAHPGELGNSG